MRVPAGRGRGQTATEERRRAVWPPPWRVRECVVIVSVITMRVMEEFAVGVCVVATEPLVQPSAIAAVVTEADDPAQMALQEAHYAFTIWSGDDASALLSGHALQKSFLLKNLLL